jgi:hypothetical protein
MSSNVQTLTFPTPALIGPIPAVTFGVYKARASQQKKNVRPVGTAMSTDRHDRVVPAMQLPLRVRLQIRVVVGVRRRVALADVLVVRVAHERAAKLEGGRQGG